jgi:hypothetical protein
MVMDSFVPGSSHPARLPDERRSSAWIRQTEPEGGQAGMRPLNSLLSQLHRLKDMLDLHLTQRRGPARFPSGDSRLQEDMI